MDKAREGIIHYMHITDTNGKCVCLDFCSQKKLDTFLEAVTDLQMLDQCQKRPKGKIGIVSAEVDFIVHDAKKTETRRAVYSV